MNTKFILGIVGGVVVVATGAYLLLNNGSEEMKSSSQESVALNNAKFADLISSGQSLECTFSHDDGENVSSGVVYLAADGDRIRGDINIEKSAAGAMEVYIIRDAGYHYVWGSSLPKGIKVVAPEPEEFFSTGGESPINEEDTEFECKDWNVEESRFTPPEDVDFQDFDSSMNVGASMELGAEGSIDSCAVCDMVTDTGAAAECKKAFQCE